MKLRALHDSVVFQFIDELATKNGVPQFLDKTDWGFIIGANIDNGLNKPRLVNVIAVGPDVDEEIKPGMRVLVEPLKWTTGVPFEGQLYWRTINEHILAIDES